MVIISILTRITIGIVRITRIGIQIKIVIVVITTVMAVVITARSVHEDPPPPEVVAAQQGIVQVRWASTVAVDCSRVFLRSARPSASSSSSGLRAQMSSISCGDTDTMVPNIQ